MTDITDEFEISDNISVDEIKQRVNSWMVSPTGRKFSIEKVSDNQIILRRAKYNLRYCTTPCWGILFGPLYLTSMGVFGMNFVLGYIFIVAGFILFSVVSFSLRPRKGNYSMTFEHGTPTQVRVDAKVNLVSSIPEYYSLKVLLRNPTQEQGPVIGV